MRRILFIFIHVLLLLTGQSPLYAQNGVPMNGMGTNNHNNGFPTDPNDPNVPEELSDTTQQIDASTIPIDLHMWTVTDLLGNIRPVEVDTVYNYFQNSNLVEGITGQNNYLGNLGSPLQSRVFFDRKEQSQYLFITPYSSFFKPPQDFRFTNTKSPFTNLTYYKAGGKHDGEELFKAYFSVNANKRLAIGFNIDYLYGRGLYRDQSTAHFNGAFFSSYISDHYEMHLLFNSFNLKMRENGGISDDRYITDPEAMSGGKKKYNPSTMETRMANTWNKNKIYYLFLTQRYNLGFQKEQTDEKTKKSTKEFVPVTSFIHTLQIDQAQRNFTSKEPSEKFYKNIYLDSLATNDRTKYLSVRNTVGLSLREGFNKWAKAGLTAFLTYDYRRFTLMDTIGSAKNIALKNYMENVVYAGGELSKTQGSLLHYRAFGEIAILGEDVGQFKIEGDMDLNFRLFKDTVQLVARAFIKNTNPSFYFRHYHANNYWWDNNNLTKEFRTRIEGELTIKRWRTNLRAGVENLKHYTYFDRNALPAQFNDNIQVLSATLRQDFKLGILHLDNEVTYQKSSNNTILPLPELSLYHNLYISAKLAKKVLSVQIGADVRYFTKYHASDYSPAIGEFHLQNPDSYVEIGGFPVVNVYVNLHLKRTRFFAMMYHVNSGSGTPNYFLVPHYPMNPRMFKIGLSWNFFD